MQAFATDLLSEARAHSYAIGAFNVYNLEGVRAVISAAEAERSPVMLQIHPASLRHGGEALFAMCLAAVRGATVPAAVHLDHSSSKEEIRAALEAGVSSVMADGSALSYDDNVSFTREVTQLAHNAGACVEAELGRLSGGEDGLPVTERDARMTDPEQAASFIQETGIDLLAVCIGNVHGRYRSAPCLDFARLAAIRDCVSVPLVLHGVSGLPEVLVRRAIEAGTAKLNVNTEVRSAYVETLKARLEGGASPELVDLMSAAIEAMQAVVATKLRVFRSSGRAGPGELA